jgi:hypothetical protein
MYKTFRSISSSGSGDILKLEDAMRAKIYTGTAVYAFYGLFLLAESYGPHQAGLLTATAADAAVLVKDYTAIRPLLHGTCRAGSSTGRILATATNNYSEVALNSTLSLDLDGTVLKRYGASPCSTASKHTAQAADAALGMCNLQTASLLGLLGGWCFFKRI